MNYTGVLSRQNGNKTDQVRMKETEPSGPSTVFRVKDNLGPKKEQDLGRLALQVFMGNL